MKQVEPNRHWGKDVKAVVCLETQADYQNPTEVLRLGREIGAVFGTGSTEMIVLQDVVAGRQRAVYTADVPSKLTVDTLR
ncbi:MAG: hypothetical protein WC480_00440 [Patescibacteria group bacterium]